jgi:septal ring factor EnvC (AmiA/AmiB activator)
MENVIRTLKSLNLKEENLPEELQDKVSYLEGLVETHNKLVDELDEKDEVTEEEETLVENQSNKIDALDVKISQEIQKFAEFEKEKKAKEESDAKAKEEADAKAKAKAEEEASKNKPQEKKGGIGFGGFLIGAVVLIATAGAYNAFKNK